MYGGPTASGPVLSVGQHNMGERECSGEILFTPSPGMTDRDKIGDRSAKKGLLNLISFQCKPWEVTLKYRPLGIFPIQTMAHWKLCSSSMQNFQTDLKVFT